MFIAFLGCDGSGKSAVIDGVTARLRADGIQVTHGHWRPKVFGVGSMSAATSADDPHGQVPRGMISSILKLGWLWLNWWLGWWHSLRKASQGGFVLFDRYHADLLVDPRRYRYGGPTGLARQASALMPQPDLVIFLDAPPEVLRSRKQEVSADALGEARKAYLNFAEMDHKVQVIDASKSLEEVVDEVCRRIQCLSEGR